MELKVKIKAKPKKEKRTTCLKCGLDLPKETSYKRYGKKWRRPNISKFCNSDCRNSYNSKIQYQRLKKDPKYIKKRRAYHKKWRTNNRERFNALARKAMKKYQAKQKTEKSKK